MVNFIPTLLVVLLNIHFFLVQSAEIVFNESSRLRTNENGSPLSSSQLSASYKYFRTNFTESLALKVLSKIFRPSISLQSVFPNLFMELIAGTTSVGFNGDNGPATSAQIRCVIPWVDTMANIYIPDQSNHRIRKVDSTGIIITFGGTGAQSFTGIGGPIGSVGFSNLISIFGDTAGTVLYISDQWYVWKYMLSSNIISVFAQSISLGQGFSGDNGPSVLSQLSQPMELWLTTSDTLYICDFANNRIRKVVSGIITTAVGSGCSGCSGSFAGDNGPAVSATLNNPRGVYVDSAGKLFIADTANNRIRSVDTNNIITTFAGSGAATPFNGDFIPAVSANINGVRDVKGDTIGNIYFADEGSCVIRLGDSNGIVSTIFGTPNSCGFSSGISPRSSNINFPLCIWIDSRSNIYFSDSNSVHRSVMLSSPTSQPSGQPTRVPTAQPKCHPSSRPSKQPTSQPTSQPSSQPSQQPTG
jgi:hypothetical protein